VNNCCSTVSHATRCQLTQHMQVQAPWLRPPLKLDGLVHWHSMQSSPTASHCTPTVGVWSVDAGRETGRQATHLGSSTNCMLAPACPGAVSVKTGVVISILTFSWLPPKM
jgi:hypothetical protein